MANPNPIGDDAVSAPAPRLPWMSRLIRSCNPFRAVAGVESRMSLLAAISMRDWPRYESCAQALMSEAAKMGRAASWAGKGALGMAIRDGSQEFLDDLLAKGADPNLSRPGEPAMLLVAKGGWPQAVAALAAAGCDPNARGHHGEAALHEAANKREVETCEALAKAGADMSAIDSAGRSPLVACLERRMDSLTDGLGANGALVRKCVAVLLAHGADPSQGAFNGLPPLAMACKRGDAKMVDMLVEAGADLSGIHAVRIGAKTPLSTSLKSIPGPHADLIIRIEALIEVEKEARKLDEATLKPAAARERKGAMRM